MSRRALTTYLAAAALALGTAPLLAQENPKPNSEQGARPNPSGSSSRPGTAAGRPSGGGSSGGAGTSSTSGGGSSSGGERPSSGSRARPGGGGFDTSFAPARPERRAAPRDRSSANSGANAGSSDQRRVAPGSATAGADASNDRRRAVPAYARPRNGRPVIGTALERRPLTATTGGIGAGSFYYYDPYYRFSNYYSRVPYGYYAGYGFGVGYLYDPWMWGFYSPYGYGGYDPYYGGGGGGYGQYSRGRYSDVGSLRLKVKPEHGQVYVDGYYVGEVDSFDGVFQKLPIDAGAHRVEIRAPGYETVQFEVMVIAGETVTYKGELKRVQ
jgi:hypothetical protein